MNVEGIWSLRLVQHSGTRHPHEDGGVIVFGAGRVLGGDSWSYYTGHYQVNDHALAFRVYTMLRRAVSGHSMFGVRLKTFYFDGKAYVAEDLNSFGATLTINGVPDVRLLALLTFEQPLEARRADREHKIPWPNVQLSCSAPLLRKH